jgi:hypothetical protein
MYSYFKQFLSAVIKWNFLQSGTCTLREAIIIGSVIARNSIPVLHSSAAILKIAEMDYTGSNSIFLRIFFDKKYALPYRVVDAVVFHFLRYINVVCKTHYILPMRTCTSIRVCLFLKYYLA